MEKSEKYQLDGNLLPKLQAIGVKSEQNKLVPELTDVNTTGAPSLDLGDKRRLPRGSDSYRKEEDSRMRKSKVQSKKVGEYL